MSEASQKSVGIIGAGLTGSLLAHYLVKHGYDVDVYEYRDDIRRVEYDSGRSINLALSTRGLTALRRVGLAKDIQRECIPMYGRRLHHLNGETGFHSYGKSHQFINSVSRNAFNRFLIEEAEQRGADVHFNHKCEDADLDDPAIQCETPDGTKHIAPDLLFGADGAYSKVRQSFLKQDGFDYTQQYLEHGYKELTIPAGQHGGFQLEPNALHIWPRDNFMMIALPNADGSFTCTLFLPYKGKNSFEQLESARQVRAFFQTYFPDVRDLFGDLEEEFFDNPTSSLVTIRCRPYHHSDKALLIGDAAHAMVPFYGQGMNAAFEDAVVLEQLMDRYNYGWSDILPAFTRERKEDADAIADLALYNYLEMRSLVKEPSFKVKHRINQMLGDIFPETWTPMYSMVTFSTRPYAEAKNLGERQQKILDKVVPESLIDNSMAIVEQLENLFGSSNSRSR